MSEASKVRVRIIAQDSCFYGRTGHVVRFVGGEGMLIQLDDEPYRPMRFDAGSVEVLSC